jgi:hypothetical protein
MIPIDNHLKTMTEKSIKPLLLGKPFLSIEATTHQFFKKMGFKTYDLLMTDRLLHLFNSEPGLTEDLYIEFNKCIEHILNMNESDYNELLENCKSVSEYNKKLINRLLYDETIINLLN